MAIEILMPSLSPTMTHGTLISWIVNTGEVVEAGDVIAEIETDKSVLEIESPIDGIMGYQKYKSGTEEIAVGAVLTVICANEAEFDQFKIEFSVPDEINDSLVGADQTKTSTVDSENVKQSDVHHSTNSIQNEERIKISPSAKREARSLSVDYSRIKGSGPGGRIIKKDIELVASKEVSTPRNLSAENYMELHLTGIEKTIAQRMQQSKREVPHFYLDLDIELDQLILLRKELNASRPEYKVSINDFIVLACGKSLKKYPAVNAQFHNNTIRQFETIDVSIAVAIKQGLITPVVKNVDNLSLSGVAAVTSQLIDKANAGKLLPDEYQGGTFTVSNLGMFGIKSFKAIVNQPQAAILAVGAGEARAIIKQGKVIAATMMTMTLSCDHRVIDGKLGAEFLAELKHLLETPALLSF